MPSPKKHHSLVNHSTAMGINSSNMAPQRTPLIGEMVVNDLDSILANYDNLANRLHNLAERVLGIEPGDPRDGCAEIRPENLFSNINTKMEGLRYVIGRMESSMNRLERIA